MGRTTYIHGCRQSCHWQEARLDCTTILATHKRRCQLQFVRRRYRIKFHGLALCQANYIRVRPALPPSTGPLEIAMLCTDRDSTSSAVGSFVWTVSSVAHCSISGKEQSFAQAFSHHQSNCLKPTTIKISRLFASW